MEINVGKADVQGKLDRMLYFENEGPSLEGEFESCDSVVYAYHRRCALPDKRVPGRVVKRPEMRSAPVDEEGSRICLFNGKYSSEQVGLKPGIPATETFEPLSSIISKCPCGERLTFLGNANPCACMACSTAGGGAAAASS